MTQSLCMDCQTQGQRRHLYLGVAMLIRGKIFLSMQGTLQYHAKHTNLGESGACTSGNLEKLCKSLGLNLKVILAVSQNGINSFNALLEFLNFEEFIVDRYRSLGA